MNQAYMSAEGNNNDKLNMRYIPMEHIKLYTLNDNIIINNREIGHIDEENAGFITKAIWKGLSKQILKTDINVNCFIDKQHGKMIGLFCIIDNREFNNSFMESSLQLFKSRNNLNTIIKTNEDVINTNSEVMVNKEDSRSYCFGEVLDKNSIEKIKNNIPNIKCYEVHNSIYIRYEKKYELNISEHNVMPLKYIRDERTILDLQKR